MGSEMTISVEKSFTDAKIRTGKEMKTKFLLNHLLSNTSWTHDGYITRWRAQLVLEPVRR
jgi:hypothetical protein